MNAPHPAERMTFVGEPIVPEAGSFATAAMGRGEPGLPRRFTWQGRPYAVAEVLEHWKETGPCTHGSGERYVRKHWFRLRTDDGLEMRLYFERQPRSRRSPRWWLHGVRGGPGPAA